ncbi:hypothetical protein Tco_1079323 [Tanacetum coccineum]|uniref:Uncharacterized protein n=1 Tax=Tanacetum coccineum TaxID=301880 RepID=A0ABQ5HRT3_9ASTR
MYCLSLAYVAHTTSATLSLSSPSILVPQTYCAVSECRFDGHYDSGEGIANLLSGCQQKQFHPPTTSSGFLQLKELTATVCMMVTSVTDPIQRKAPGNVDNQALNFQQYMFQPIHEVEYDSDMDEGPIAAVASWLTFESGDVQEEHLTPMLETERD